MYWLSPLSHRKQHAYVRQYTCIFIHMTWVDYSLVPRPSLAPVFEPGEGLGTRLG